jgi:hypothetical protein
MNAADGISPKAFRDLLDENATLKEALRQMHEVLLPAAIVPSAWGLGRRESDLLLALREVAPRVLRKERAMIALYGVMGDDVPDQKILDVLICTLRRKLVDCRARVQIETVWGRGWRIDPESMGRLDEHIRRASEPAWQPGTPLLIAAE